jgi:hypothetical protein
MPVKPPETPKPKFNTLTTAGRVAKAAYERAAMESNNKDPTETPSQTTSPPTSPTTPSAPVKKKRKMRILPPPHELAAEASLKAAAEEAKLSSKKKKAPLTTKEKLAASAAARARENERKQPVVHDGVGLKVVESGVWSMAGGGDGTKSKGGKGKKKAAAEKPKNLMDFMRDFKQMPSTARAEPKGKKTGGDQAKVARESVLVRATERTMRLKTDVDRSEGPVGVKSEYEYDNSSGSRLMALPLEVRQRIWRLVVVEKQFFVYPAISPEQPDLAMTSRQIRGEVLPLYYGENTFAVEIPVEMERKIGSGRMSVRKWTTALKGHMGAINKWAFSLVLPAGDVPNAGMPTLKISRELVISLQYPKSGTKKHVQPEVEIHRQGSCLLPSHEEYPQCARLCYPRWVDDALAAALLTEKDDRGKQVMQFAASVEGKGHELVGSQCLDATEIVDVEDD